MNQKGFAVQILILILLIIGLGVTVYLTQNITHIFSKAAPPKSSQPEESFTLELENNAVSPFPDEEIPDTILKGSKFRVDVYTRSDIEAANLFNLKIQFPVNMLKVVEINNREGQSFVKNWVDSSFDNSTGEISLAAGIPHPGIKTDIKSGSLLMTSIIFEAKENGSVNINILDASSIYSDNSNLDIISKDIQKAKNTLKFNIQNKAPGRSKINKDCAIFVQGGIKTKLSFGGVAYQVNSESIINLKAQADPVITRLSWKVLTKSEKIPERGNFEYPESSYSATIVSYRAPANPIQTEESITLGADILDNLGNKIGSCSEIVLIVNPKSIPKSNLKPSPATVPVNLNRNGDVNKDNKFDLVDMSNLLTQFDPSKTGVVSEADLNGDGVINSFDFLKEREILISKGVIKRAAVTNEDIDTLDYFITNHQDKGLDGDHTENYTDFTNGHPMSQTILGNRSYYVKWASEVFEIHSWDTENIYLNEDHSGAPVSIYTFNPGVWLKRSMKVGDVITGSSNTIQWYDNSCKKGATDNFPIQVTLEKHDPNYNVGGDLGTQDVIVVKYDSSVGLTTGVYERFYYSKEWGWVRWEEYSKSTGSLTSRRTFNKIISPIKPSAGLSCFAPYSCPVSEWIDCMPVITPDGKGLNRPQCDPDYLKWAKENCPGFKGATY